MGKRVLGRALEMMSNPKLLFCWYAPEDKHFFDAFKKHCAPRLQKKEFELFDEGCIPPGGDRAKEIEEHAAKADMFVFLMSSDFNASEDCIGMVRRADGRRHASTVPIRIRDCDVIEELEIWQCLPTISQPSIQGAKDQDTAWVSVIEELAKIMCESKSRLDEPLSAGIKEGSVRFHKASGQHETGRALLYVGRLKKALRKFRKARGELKDLLKRHPDDKVYNRELARLNDAIGQALYSKGDQGAARSAFDKAFALRCDLLSVAPKDVDIWRTLVASRYWRGHLYFIQEKYKLAYREQFKGIVLCDLLLKERPGDADVLRDLVVLQTDLGTTLAKREHLGEAERMLRKARASAKKQCETHPKNLRFRRDYSVSLFRLVDVLLEVGHLDEAYPYAEEAVRQSEEVSRGDPDNLQWKRHRASSRIRLGRVFEAQGELAKARAEYQCALDIMNELLKEAPDHTTWKQDQQDVLERLNQLPASARV